MWLAEITDFKDVELKNETIPFGLKIYFKGWIIKWKYFILVGKNQAKQKAGIKKL